MWSIANIALVELLLFSAFWFLIGALDDLIVDIIWFSRKAYRKLRYYVGRSPMLASELPDARDPGLLAIFVPTWQEESVIGEMLANCRNVWSRGASDAGMSSAVHSATEHVIYVGCYSNDTATLAAAQKAADADVRVNVVCLPHHGPTSKADCLNHLWKALCDDEIETGREAKAIILHDAEDVVHAQELRIFDRLIESHPAVQIPVLPLPVPNSPFISGHYCDEFAEAHGKSLVVREALGASVPLAGVGCAIDRTILGRIADEAGGEPFDIGSLTEDYELGFKIARHGQTILVRMRDDNGGLVASRAYFPADIGAAVRQKARWMTGIALAGWDRIGWRGGIAQKWMLLRDRSALLAAIVLFAAYLCVLLTGFLSLAYVAGFYEPAEPPEYLVTLLWTNLGFLAWRLFVRALFVTQLYGFAQGLMTIPRSFVANIIAIMAARRACAAYVRYLLGAPLVWDKTEHTYFPDADGGLRRG